MFYGTIAHPAAWIVAPMISISVFVAGYVVFERLRPNFGDAI
jgi:ABC-type polysaccharide/polyol phosphate export permease